MLVKDSRKGGDDGTLLPTVPVTNAYQGITSNIANVSSSDIGYNARENLDSLADYKNAIVAGDKNFDNIRADFCDTAKDTISRIELYTDLASRAMQEVETLIEYDQAVRAEALRMYSAHMAATSPHYQEYTAGGKIIKESTYEQDVAEAIAKCEAYWNANKSWVWG